MTTTSDIAAAVKARLDTTGFDSFDGPPPDDYLPTGPYHYLADDPGMATRNRYTARSGRLAWTGQIVCAGASRAGQRAAVDAVRDVLTDWQPLPDDRSAGRLTETEAGPELTDGPTGDRRTSRTLTYRLSAAR